MLNGKFISKVSAFNDGNSEEKIAANIPNISKSKVSAVNALDLINNLELDSDSNTGDF